MSDYIVKGTDGGLLGPLSFATLRDLFTTGHVTADAEVSVDRKPFQPLISLPELQSLIGVNKSARPAVPSYSGFLEEHSFFKVFFRLAIAKETGRTLVQRGELRKEIFLFNGAPVFVGSNLPDERIGEYLVSQGAITRQQLGDALTIAHNFSNHLGTTLMGMKVITPHMFYEHLVGQLRQKMMSVVDWQSGRYDFFKGVLYDGPKLPVEINPLELLTEAMRSRLKKNDCERRLGDRMDKPLVHAPTQPVPIDRLMLAGVEQRLYESMNDMRTAADLAAELPANDDGRTALAMVYYLLELGFVQTV